jgi:hypothetical protein
MITKMGQKEKLQSILPLAPQSEGGYLSLLLAFQQAVSSDAFSMPFDL